MLVRSEFKRVMPVKEPKPIKGPRKRRCKVCREQFVPRSITHKACGPECAAVVAQSERQAIERKADRVRKQALKSRRDWMKEAQVAFNTFVRQRDKDKPCICCGRVETQVSGLNSHGWDCGHYRSVGSAPHMRFNENNAHRQLVLCNRHGAGRAVDYRIGLIARIGLAAVEALESDQTPCKWTVEELQTIKAKYRQKLKELKGNV